MPYLNLAINESSGSPRKASTDFVCVVCRKDLNHPWVGFSLFVESHIGLLQRGALQLRELEKLTTNHKFLGSLPHWKILADRTAIEFVWSR